MLDTVQRDGAQVPAIWPLEVLNTLVNVERRARISEFQSHRFLATLRALPIVIQKFRWDEHSEDVLRLGRELNLSAYDATYLDIAVRRGLPLATQDRRLREEAQRLGVPLA